MTKPPEPVVTGELKVTQEDRDRLLEILALWDIGRKQEALEQVARHRTAHALSGDVVSAVVVEKIETVAGDFSTESGEPFWRVRIGEQCADFDFEQAARNFADAIAALTPSALSGDAGEGWMPIQTAPKDGEHVLLFSPDASFGCPMIGYWLDDGWTDFWEGSEIDADPSHWQPLPKPPALPSHQGAE